MAEVHNSLTPYTWKWQGIAFAIGLFIATSFVVFIDRMHQATIKELTLGQMGEHSEKWDQDVLCVDLTRSQSKQCVRQAEAAEGDKVLWLGNSQLPTINQWQAGDRTMVSILHDRLAPYATYVLGCAPPNANLQEHLVIAHYLFPRIKPKVLLLPVFYDDLRETGIREQLNAAFEDSAAKATMQHTPVGSLLLKEHEELSRATTPAPTASASTLDWSEEKLTGWLDERSHYWAERGTYRSVLFVNMFYLRNTIFGIKADSIRRMIPSRFERNMAALQEIFDLANHDKIRVFVYVPPIRNDVPIPYDMAAYSQFKQDLGTLVKEQGFVFANLENEIPAEDWGTKEAAGIGGGQEIDFMHFSAKGHARLATAIERLLKESNLLPATMENSK